VRNTDVVDARHRIRQLVNAANLSTPIGLGVARAGRANITRGPRGLLFASGYRRSFPTGWAFTIGNVVVTRAGLEELRRYPRVLAHEERHAWQYALLGGPLYWPLYGVAMAWSMLRTGDRASRNVFERSAGLSDGGYLDRPIRPVPVRIARLRRLGADH
jgi:hypothetical protein